MAKAEWFVPERSNRNRFHTTTHGAFGAWDGCRRTDMATIMISEAWLRVPEIVENRIEGEAPETFIPRSHTACTGTVKADGAVYKAIDFTGSYVDI
jgi:3-isopropylmalate/(R)-2-methylmalate dehydratase large subunit